MDAMDATDTMGAVACPAPRCMPDGVNFSLFSRHASGVELLLFDREDDPRPARIDLARAPGQPHLLLLARVRPGRPRGTALRAIA